MGGSRKNCLRSDIWSLGCIMAELLMRTVEWESSRKKMEEDGKVSGSSDTGQDDPEEKRPKKMGNATYLDRNTRLFEVP